MSFCVTGASTNCPSDPPALIRPDAAPRACAGSRCAAAPISTEKLQAPDPAADNTPRVIDMPSVVSIQGVSKAPSIITNSPTSSTGRGPQ